MAVNQQTAIASFREIYIILQVNFSPKATYDDTALQAIMATYLSDAYTVVPDGEKPSDDSWGFRCTDPSIIFGYNPQTNGSDEGSSIVSIARMDTSNYETSLKEMQKNMQEGALLAGREILEKVAVESVEIEAVLYYDPFADAKDEMHQSLLKKLTLQLMPSRRDNDDVSFERFSMDYTTTYKDDFIRSIGYGFAKNLKTKRASLQTTISITKDDIKSVDRAIEAFHNIDIVSEIVEEAAYLNGRKEEVI